MNKRSNMTKANEIKLEAMNKNIEVVSVVETEKYLRVVAVDSPDVRYGLVKAIRAAGVNADLFEKRDIQSFTRYDGHENVKVYTFFKRSAANFVKNGTEIAHASGCYGTIPMWIDAATVAQAFKTNSALPIQG